MKAAVYVAYFGCESSNQLVEALVFVTGVHDC